jgi:hypothetical protein
VNLANRIVPWTLALVVAGASWLGMVESSRAGTPSALQRKIAARQHYLGEDNVNPRTGAVAKRKFVLSWFGVSSLAMAINGHVVLLDGYINTAQTNDMSYVGTSYGELADLHPEALFIGHAHGDHAQGVSFIAEKNPGLRIYGTPEQCDQVRADAVTNGYKTPIRCLGVVSPGSPAGTQLNNVPALKGVCAQVVKHLHSNPHPPDPDYPLVETPFMFPDIPTVLMHPPGRAVAEPADEGIKSAGNEGFSLLWQFSLGKFTFTWNDTEGPLKEEAPQILDLFRTKLWPTSIHAGALAGLDIPNFWRDPALYEKAIESRLYIPLHHDFPTSYGLNRDWQRLYRKWLGVVGIPADHQPRFRWLSDPDDYLQPLVFDPSGSYWSTQPRGDRPTSPCARSTKKGARSG